MPIRLNVTTRIAYADDLAAWLRSQVIAIGLEDQEMITTIRVKMVGLIMEMYCYQGDQVDYAMNRYNDLMAGIDMIHEEKEKADVRHGLRA